METLLIIFALVFAIVGLLGSILPALPGAPLSYVGLLLLLPCEGADISNTALWVYGIFLAIVSILDYIAPVWLTNLSGGGQQATRASMAGLVAGLFFFPPWMAILLFGVLMVAAMIFGLLPAPSLLRKTPAAILTKYDI